MTARKDCCVRACAECAPWRWWAPGPSAPTVRKRVAVVVVHQSQRVIIRYANDSGVRVESAARPQRLREVPEGEEAAWKADWALARSEGALRHFELRIRGEHAYIESYEAIQGKLLIEGFLVTHPSDFRGKPWLGSFVTRRGQGRYTLESPRGSHITVQTPVGRPAFREVRELMKPKMKETH